MSPGRWRSERARLAAGAVVYAVTWLAGAASLVHFFLLVPLASHDPAARFASMIAGAVCALPPLALYLWVPRLFDRFDPEPAWALALVLLWGAVGACGISAALNTAVEQLATDAGGRRYAEMVTACVSAPLVEEAMKGAAVLGVFFFLRREFDGMVDGVLYATYAALGFAAVENIVYYSRAVAEPGRSLAATFLMRGVLSPWVHPLYASMTGLGIGLARETTRAWARWAAPLGGYAAAVTLHVAWNAAGARSGYVTVAMLPLWLAFVVAFGGLLASLVARKGRIIRRELRDEVLLGNMTGEELRLAGSAFAELRASVSWGGEAGRRFVRAAARLALCKWHAARARRARHGRSDTLSSDRIAPLRDELRTLRADVSRALGRPVPEPRPWQSQQANPGGR